MSQNNRLSYAQREEIRRRYAEGETQEKLARAFGVTNQVICYHVNPIFRERHNRNNRHGTCGRDPESPRQ